MRGYIWRIIGARCLEYMNHGKTDKSIEFDFRQYIYHRSEQCIRSTDTLVLVCMLP